MRIGDKVGFYIPRTKQYRQGVVVVIGKTTCMVAYRTHHWRDGKMHPSNVAHHITLPKYMVGTDPRKDVLILGGI